MNYVPDGKVALLVGDKGAYDRFPTPTKVGGVTVSATIEEQSTTRLHVLPRMTTVQMAAVTTQVDGMMGYDTTLNDLIIRKNGVLTPVTTNPLNVLYTSLTLTTAQVQGMFAAGVPLIAAPGANKLILINKIALYKTFGAADFTNGGVTYLQYGLAGAGAVKVGGDVAAAFLTGGAASQWINNIPLATTITAINSVNVPVSITNATAAFATGGTSTLTCHVWYSIVPTA